jgi:hypothetical protein
MRRYRVLARSFIGGTLVEEGEIVSLPADQKTSGNLEPLDPEPIDRAPLPIPKRKLPAKPE